MKVIKYFKSENQRNESFVLYCINNHGDFHILKHSRINVGVWSQFNGKTQKAYNVFLYIHFDNAEIHFIYVFARVTTDKCLKNSPQNTGLHERQ